MIMAQQLHDKEKMGFKKAFNFNDMNVYRCPGRYARDYLALLQGTMDVFNIRFIGIEEEFNCNVKVGHFQPTDKPPFYQHNYIFEENDFSLLSDPFDTDCCSR